nr:MAG TPA: hypothetical protein [Caudoviricetes sp.]
MAALSSNKGPQDKGRSSPLHCRRLGYLAGCSGRKSINS